MMYVQHEYETSEHNTTGTNNTGKLQYLKVIQDKYVNETQYDRENVVFNWVLRRIYGIQYTNCICCCTCCCPGCYCCFFAACIVVAVLAPAMHMVAQLFVCINLLLLHLALLSLLLLRGTVHVLPWNSTVVFSIVVVVAASAVGRVMLLL